MIGEDELIFLFKGNFNQNVLLSIQGIASGEMKSSKENFLMYKRVNHLIIEMVQNIMRYEEIPTPDHIISTPQYKPSFLFGRQDNAYLISSGNLISADRVPALDNYLQYLNGYANEHDRLVKFYKKAIKSVIEWGRKGKMGFIEMLMKSQNRIEFDFKQVDEHYYYFSYLLKIEHVEIPVPTDSSC